MTTFRPRSIASKDVKETIEAKRKRSGDERRARKSVLRNNCRPFICIVFRILKRSLREKRTTLADLFGGLAQLGERLPCKQEVSGSNPLISIHGSLAQSVRALA